jgi:transglutaminase-like putative cysteine protease
MRYRMSIMAAVAVVAASFSLFSVIEGADWLYAGVGAVIAVGAAGMATRLSGLAAGGVATAAVTAAVVPLLTSGSWAGVAGGVALIALAAGRLAIRRVLPAVAGALTYLAGLFLYLNLVFAPRQSFGWIIPSVRSARHLGRLVQLGYAEHVFAPPVPGVRGLELIAAAGMGIIAILTDLIAVRLRSPAVAGLPLLVLFSVPVATNLKNDGVGLTLAFCVGITGYLALLTADGRDRLRLWGRLVTVWQDTPEDEGSRGPDTRALAASGRRIGLAAVALAVVLPLALPAAQQHGLFGRTAAPGAGGAGGPQVAAPQPLVAMSSQLHDSRALPLLTYKTTAPQPRQQYLQVYVLTDFNAARQQFTLAGRGPSVAFGAQAPLSPPGLGTSGFETVKTTITVGKSDQRTSLSYLPVPYAPQALSGAGSGVREDRATLMLYAFGADNGLTYTVTSKVPDPSQTELAAGSRVPASVARTYLAYGGPDQAQLTRIADAITRGARTPFQKGEELENYFTRSGNFTYSLGPGVATTVTQFLTTDKRGFCQQFATAMAVLARLVGVPSRLAVGYTAGSLVGHHVWQVTTADAHAWPELYIPGSGWLRFEPTPGGPSAQGTAIRPAYPGIGSGSTVPLTGPSASVPTGVKGAGNTPGIKKPIPEGVGGPLHSGPAPAGGFPVGWLVLAIIVVLAAAPGLTRLAARQRRWLRARGDAERAHAAWRELTGDLADYGLRGAASESPRALAQRVASMAEVGASGRQAVARIAAAEERARYARVPGPGGELQADTRAARRAVARASGPRRRWQARLLPASVLVPAGRWLRDAADVVGWLEAAGTRARQAGRRRLRTRRAG